MGPCLSLPRTILISPLTVPGLWFAPLPELSPPLPFLPGDHLHHFTCFRWAQQSAWYMAKNMYEQMNERKEWGTHLGSPRIQTMTCLETQVSSISCVWYSGPSGFLQLLLEGWWPQTHGPMTPVSSQHSPCLGQAGRRQPVPSLSQGPSAGHRDLSSATGLGLAGHSRFCFLTGSGGMKI